MLAVKNNRLGIKWHGKCSKMIDTFMSAKVKEQLEKEQWSETSRRLVMESAMMKALVAKEREEKQTNKDECNEHADCGVSEERI